MRAHARPRESCPRPRRRGTRLAPGRTGRCGASQELLDEDVGFVPGVVLEAGHVFDVEDAKEHELQIGECIWSSSRRNGGTLQGSSSTGASTRTRVSLGMRTSGGTTITGLSMVLIKPSATWPAGIFCAGNARAPIAIARTSGRVAASVRTVTGSPRCSSNCTPFRSATARAVTPSPSSETNTATTSTSRSAANHCPSATTGPVAAESSTATTRCGTQSR